jgi:hypothetical protein
MSHHVPSHLLSLERLSMPDTRLMQLTDESGHKDKNLLEEFVGLLSCRCINRV